MNQNWTISTVMEHQDDTCKSLVVMRLDNQYRPGMVFWEDHPTSFGLVRFALHKLPPSDTRDREGYD
jgi:hypothetical protein